MQASTSSIIRIIDLNRQYLSIKPEIDRAVIKALENSQFILGPEVAAFEEEFAAYCGARHGIGVNSGTSALHLALLAAGVGPGDEVVTVPFTFVATAAAIGYTGAKPVFVDIDPATFNLNPELLEAAITPRTKAILPVHLYGQPVDFDPIREIAGDRGIPVIEDAAQAHGAEYKGVRAGALGEMACFSFYPTKNLGACGEGGMITTDDSALAARLRLLRDWGTSAPYRHEIRAFNYRMEGIQGAILRVKLRHLEEWTETRRARASEYDHLLGGLPLVETPQCRADVRHVYHCYVIRTPVRRQLAAYLSAQGVESRIHYPIPVHLQPAYADLGYGEGSFPESEKAASEVLALPMHGHLTAEETASVVDAIRAYTREAGHDGA